MSQSAKKQLGQFMTTNYEYILQSMQIPQETLTIIEPFMGKGDLLKFIDRDQFPDVSLECYDIDPHHELAIERDTLMDPPSYENKFVLTNPPYLGRNKSPNKEIFDKYKANDLYKCFIYSIIIDCPIGGIIIIPLNFLSSIRKSDILLRHRFLQKFIIEQVNIFEERVFDDTSYTVCSLQFQLRSRDQDERSIKIDIYPSQMHIETALSSDNNYLIGGNIYNLTNSGSYKISRLTKLTKDIEHTNILVKCIDDNLENQIALSIVDDKHVYIDNTANLSARSYATLQIDPPIDIIRQELLVKKFNEFLTDERKKYNSLFLTNFRESSNIARKRISFALVYSICAYLLDQI